VAWWFTAELLGWSAFPVARLMLGKLRDQGFGLSRAFGLLLGGYLFWSLTSAGLLRNDLGGALAALLALVGMGVWAYRRRRQALAEWIRSHTGLVLWTEGIFLVAFLGWALVRAANPEILGTEKPMELALLNGILHSPVFPPRDVWLSGYSISYYYFGYILVGWLARLTGVTAGVAFNLANALWFALAVVGAHSLLYNLLPRSPAGQGVRTALLGPLFVVILANLEGPLDVLHSLHVGWTATPQGGLASEFWPGLGLKDLSDPPAGAPVFRPDRHYWWWRASRVIHDVNLAGQDVEVIDEFPFFSFLLADNHPHLLAMPFVMLAVAFCLHVFHGGHRPDLRMAQASPGLLRGLRLGLSLAVITGAVFTAARASARGDPPADVLMAFTLVIGLGLPGIYALSALFLGEWPSVLTPRELLAVAWLFGGLAFLNTWDFPIYTALLLAALAWTLRSRPPLEVAARLLLTGLAAGVGAVVLYGFWYIGFASQAGGVLPNLAFPTRFVQFAIMFGPLLAPMVVWLIRETSRRRPFPVRLFAGVGLGAPLFLLAASAVAATLAFSLYLRNPLDLNAVLDKLGAPDTQVALQQIAERRLTHSVTALFLGGVLGLCAVLVAQENRQASAAPDGSESPRAFLAMMIGLGALLVLAPEFLYLKDSFGDRMNTIFKFYFAAWIVWALAAAWTAWDLRPRASTAREWARTLVYLPVLLGLVYPPLALSTKTSGAPERGLHLDGTLHLRDSQPADFEAIGWMTKNLPDGVVAEAVGGSYSPYGRIAAHTGFPTVLGWNFHEIQWGRDVQETITRENDVRLLYETRDWDEAQQILVRYNVAYVYVGPLESIAYPPLFQAKFDIFLTPVYRSDQVTIYEVPPQVPGTLWAVEPP
jgi:uncharacterized membrane protein